MKNVINWFEIPVLDFNRAVNFYDHILDVKIETGEMGGCMMGFFPAEGLGGALVQCQNHAPSNTGVLIYLNAGEDLSVVLGKIEPAGGKIDVSKTMITAEIGYFAIFHDTEGNRIGLHSPR